MDYRELAPAPELRSHVRTYWFLRAEAPSIAPAIVERILPDGSPELILHLGEPYARLRDGAEERQPQALIVGQLTGPLLLRPSRLTRIAAVRFEPQGLAAFLPVPAHELRDGHVRADEAWGADGARLAERAEGQSGEEGIARVLDAFLLARRRRGADARVAGCVSRLRAAAGARRVDELAREAGCTPRQLERLFLRDVGLSPKRLARTFRLQAAMRLLRRPELSLAEVAQLSGHADQPHLVREMRELGGVTPSSLRREPPEMAAAIGAG